MSYVLWNTQHANSMGPYSTEEHALEVVRKYSDVRGPEAAKRLALIVYRDDAPDEPEHIAAGEELLKRARLIQAA